MLQESTWTYFTSEGEFVKYFDRLLETGMSFDEIETKLPQLETYYYEMVIKGVFYDNQPTLQKLFENWKKNRE